MTQTIVFPGYSGIRCLMMPYVQGDPDSVPDEYDPYREIIATTFLEEGKIGFLTIDESPVTQGNPHRGDRAKFGRALHTEAGRRDDILMWGGGYTWGSPPPSPPARPPSPPAPTPEPYRPYTWGGYSWGGGALVTLDRDVEILLANNTDGTCAIWNAEHLDTSEDGDIGDQAHLYPYEDAIIMKAGEVQRIGILTPHESLPVDSDIDRQFLRIIGNGVHGREPHFTVNPLFEVG